MSNESAKIEYESGVVPYLMGAITDSGDRTLFTTSADLFSETQGNSPDVRPDGVLTGGDVTIAVSGANNAVDVGALTCYLAGALVVVTAELDEAITRPATNVAKVNSITVNSSGAVAVIAGTDSLSAAFTETRGAAGGPPFIPVGSIELAQVRVVTSANAALTPAQIFKVVGTHREMATFPAFTVDNFTGSVTFEAPIAASHTGNLAKGVFASYAEPIFTEQKFGNDWVPAETAHSVSSTNTYSGPRGSTSSTLNQASFTAILNDGITDGILSMKNQNIMVRFYQNKFRTPFMLTQGLLGISRTFNVDNDPAVTCTISSNAPSVERQI
jgi:hypothetical protein